MHWNETLRQIADLVEEHLQRKEEPLDPRKISEIAGCSYGFFQKVFSYMNGMSFAEYLRARKLTLAGYELKRGGCRVVDVSYKYGYESPTSFTKAFRRFHGVTPTQAGQPGVTLRVLPKLRPDRERQYAWRLERRPPLRLVGQSTALCPEQGPLTAQIPAIWSECRRSGAFDRLHALDAGSPPGLFGLFLEQSQAPGAYFIGARCEKQAPRGFCAFTLPAADWAVFDCRGPVPSSIQDGWAYLSQEWLVRYPFRHAACPELEWYSDGDPCGGTYLSQIWIPILQEE